jgi:hypothetical protein
MFEWKIEYLAEENILLVTTKGQMDVSSANAMVKDVAEKVLEFQCFAHIVDHRQTTFLFQLSDYYDRPTINEKLGVSRQFKTAMVFSRLTEDTKFMQTVFTNRGYTVRHFTDMEEAKAWLKS